jgi:glycine dehydrogenase subunit 2
VVLSEALAPFAPVPFVRKTGSGLELVEHSDDQHLGRITAFNGQMGMYVRALTYMLSHGGDGLAQAAKDAVLNANYVKARLEQSFSVPFAGAGACMHEALFDDHFLEGTGVTTLDFAKAMIDEGFHPMTMYFPLVVHGAMLVEPTESESKQTLDVFCDTMLALSADAKAGNAARFTSAPMRAPRRRLDETRAARQPKLKWERPLDLPVAAE